MSLKSCTKIKSNETHLKTQFQLGVSAIKYSVRQRNCELDELMVNECVHGFISEFRASVKLLYIPCGCDLTAWVFGYDRHLAVTSSLYIAPRACQRAPEHVAIACYSHSLPFQSIILQLIWYFFHAHKKVPVLRFYILHPT